MNMTNMAQKVTLTITYPWYEIIMFFSTQQMIQFFAKKQQGQEGQDSRCPKSTTICHHKNGFKCILPIQTKLFLCSMSKQLKPSTFYNKKYIFF